jgi:Tol biopolymer transport system component
MGEEINSAGSENRPYVSPDGKYFIFTSTRNGSRDVFWVGADYLDRFRK